MDIEGNGRSSGGPYIETVRSLHQTVIALRTALEESKREILDLKTKAWPIDSIEQSLTSLAIENHVLRRKLLDNNISHQRPSDSQPNSPCIAREQIGDIKVDADEATDALEKQTYIRSSLEDDKDIAKTNIGDSISEAPFEQENRGDHLLIEKHPTLEVDENKSNSPEENLQSEKTFQKKLIDTNNLSQRINTNIVITEKQEPKKLDISVAPKRVVLESQTDTVDLKESFENHKTPEDKRVHFTDTSSTVTNLPVTDQKKAKKVKHTIRKQNQNPCTLKIKGPKHRIRASICIKAKTSDDKKLSRSLESLTVVKTPFDRVTFSKTTSFFDLNSEVSCEISKDGLIMTDKNNVGSKNKVEVEHNQSSSKSDEDTHNDVDPEPEVDDIELIFTTDDTKESDFKEQLVSIDSLDEGQNDASGLKLMVPDLEQSLDISDRELDDDVFDPSFENENPENSYQVFQLRRDNSQLYNSKSDNSINQEEKSLRSYYSYQDSSFENKSLEKDESFDRFEERIRIVETDISKVGIQEVEYAGFRRNTCPNPLQYRPLLHREAMTKGLNIKKSRPILAHSNAIRKESGAQTDISALPGSAWRSESSLGNKAHLADFTTLPSKFPMPGSRLKLSEKTTVEARRVLLSDIGFTSMVPELSRSADHLFPSNLKPPVTSYGQFLRTPELYSPAYTSQRFTWTNTTATPSDGSHSHSRFSMHPLSPPVQTRRCSAPVSPSRRATLKSTPSRVRFANGSLPELRGDWTQMTADSEDSTDSLVEEAENYLRRSIDCILGSSKETDYGCYSDANRNIYRRASAPVSTSDNIPPQGWQPFLPRQPRDLKPDHWVKVITPEGKVKGGRVRYIGPVASQTEHFIGVQLPVPEGHSDGTYSSRRYFQCEPSHGIFVPFKKVIMGWRP